METTQERKFRFKNVPQDVAGYLLRKVQRRQRSTIPMIIYTQLNTARRQTQPMWGFHHMHNLPL